MKRMLVAVSTALLSLGFIVANAATQPAAAGQESSFAREVALVRSGALGYRVPDPVAYVQRKAAAAGLLPALPSRGKTGPKGTIGVQWDGLFQGNLTPSDSTGAIGPNSYIELVNTQYGIYMRDGTLINSGTLQQLLGGNGGDPQIVWDNNDQRFYAVDFNNSFTGLVWGFSKNNNPQSSADFCKYTMNLWGSNIPDYPKLGDSPHFLLVGVNEFNSSGTQFLGGDLAFVSKGSVGPNPISTCPPQSQFQIGKFSNIKNADGTMINAPNPANNTEPGLPSRAEGWVVGVSANVPSNYVTVYGVFPTAVGPRLSGPFTVSVPTFTDPPSAPQCGGTGKLLDTIDSRLKHAMASADPVHGSNDAIWTAHDVAGGAGSKSTWYEIDPTTNPPSLIQSADISDSSLFVFNAGISSDRVVNPSGSAFGGDMSTTITTTSLAACPAVQDVSKIGNNPQSAFVMVKQSPGPDTDFSCGPVCRWGDYSGATPDPAASLGGTEGNVWHSNMWYSPGCGQPTCWRTENYEIIP